MCLRSFCQSPCRCEGQSMLQISSFVHLHLYLYLYFGSCCILQRWETKYVANHERAAGLFHSMWPCTLCSSKWLQMTQVWMNCFGRFFALLCTHIFPFSKWQGPAFNCFSVYFLLKISDACLSIWHIWQTTWGSQLPWKKSCFGFKFSLRPSGRSL